MKAFKVTLTATNGFGDTYYDVFQPSKAGQSDYITIRDCTIYVVAKDVTLVANRFPDAKNIEDVGVGMFVKDMNEYDY